MILMSKMSDNRKVEDKLLKGGDLIDRLTFLDTRMGLTYCANSEVHYGRMLKAFLERDLRDELSFAYDNMDWDEYRGALMELKITSREIGAMNICEQAESLEKASLNGNRRTIMLNHAALMQNYHQILNKIELVIEEKNAKDFVSDDADISIIDSQTKILIIDSDDMNRQITHKILSRKYTVNSVSTGNECLNYLEKNRPDLILMDVNISDMNGVRLLEIIKANDDFKIIPVILMTTGKNKMQEEKGISAGAMDFVKKPIVAELLLSRVNQSLELHQIQSLLRKAVLSQQKKAKERHQIIEQMSFDTVITLANAIDGKDKYTNGHSTRVADYAALIALELGFSKEAARNLRYAGLLHDVGKIAVPDAILNKPSRLTAIEYDLIKAHTTMGGEILKRTLTIDEAENVARFHHERYDGKGYPNGLKGEEIPIEARIVCVADTFDAMNTRRVYRKALEKEVIRDEFVKGIGTQFDPDVAKAFLKLFDEGAFEDTARIDSLFDEYKNEDEQIENSVEDQTGFLLRKMLLNMTRPKDYEDVDFLTGLLLRKSGQSAIAKAMQGTAGCMAVIDMDNLRRINNNMGHRAGDRALKLLGNIIKDYSKNSIACRMGGDQFLVFMEGVDKNEARNRIKAILKDFLTAKEADSSIRLASLSAGLCMCEASDMFEDICKKVDRALYFVKQNGKSGFYFFKREDNGSSRSAEVDLKQLIKNLSNNGEYLGALDVEYREFAKMFEYLRNIKNRFGHEMHLAMITVTESNRDLLADSNNHKISIEEGILKMDETIKNTIRSVDICTKYSSNQFLVIFFEVGEDNVSAVMQRIVESFAKECEDSFNVSYYSSSLD